MVTQTFDETAELLIKKGYWPFPVKDKVPLVPFKSGKKSDDLALVHSAMTHWAVRTGKEQNLLVVDQDEGAAPFSENYSQKTTRGWHFYHSYPALLTAKNTQKKKAGFDTRGDGGYVVVYDADKLPAIADLSPMPQGLYEEFYGDKPVSSPVSRSNWVSRALEQLGTLPRRPTLLRIAGKLWRGGLDEGSILSLLSPVANKAGTPLDELQRIVADVAKYPQPPKPTLKTFENDWDGYRARLADRQTYKAPELPTGIQALDDVTWGLRRGDVLVVGARTGLGKSSLALTISNHLVKKGKTVLYASTEMEEDEIFSRLIAMNTEIDSFRLISGQLTDEDRKKLALFDRASLGSKMLILGSFRPSLAVFEDAIEETIPDLIIVDSIQHTESKRDSRVLDLEDMIVGLKALAMHHKIAVIVTSQLSRDAEYRDPKTGKFPLPSLRHLKWCGAIEEEASQVILLSRPSENLAEAEEEEIVFNVLKNRRGRTAFLTVRFQKLFNRFNGG